MIVDLIERVPAPTRADVQDALSGLFNRATGYEQFFEAVRIAVARKHETEYAMPAVPKFGGNARYIGKRVKKVDATQLVSGEKAFVEDRVENGACILKVLRSPHAHAKITAIETAAAEALPGVVAVFTHANVPRKPYSQAGQGFPEPLFDGVFAVREARIVGERHWKLRLAAEEGEGARGRRGDAVDAIAFNQVDTVTVMAGHRVHIAYRLDVNEYGGIRRPQLVVESMQRL